MAFRGSFEVAQKSIQVREKRGTYKKRDEYTKQEEDHKTRVQSLDEQLGRLTQEQEKKSVCDLQGYSGVQSLTKELADKLIERIDVYDQDRVEVT